MGATEGSYPYGTDRLTNQRTDKTAFLSATKIRKLSMDKDREKEDENKKTRGVTISLRTGGQGHPTRTPPNARFSTFRLVLIDRWTKRQTNRRTDEREDGRTVRRRDRPDKACRINGQSLL